MTYLASGIPSVTSSFAAELYRDIKGGVRWASAPIIPPVQRYFTRKGNLAAFRRDFASHDASTTDLVSYREWHESDKDWRQGNGNFCSATFGELTQLWTRVERFAPYEARLSRFIDAGGEAKRLFVLGPNFNDDSTRLLLYRTLRRHEKLGFDPRVLSVLDLKRAAEVIGVKCDAMGSFNGRIGYFTQCQKDGDPILVRTMDETIAPKVQDIVTRLWSSADTAGAFFKRHQWQIPKEVKNLAKADIKIVKELALKNGHRENCTAAI